MLEPTRLRQEIAAADGVGDRGILPPEKGHHRFDGGEVLVAQGVHAADVGVGGIAEYILLSARGMPFLVECEHAFQELPGEDFTEEFYRKVVLFRLVSLSDEVAFQVGGCRIRGVGLNKRRGDEEYFSHDVCGSVKLFGEVYAKSVPGEFDPGGKGIPFFGVAADLVGHVREAGTTGL